MSEAMDPIDVTKKGAALAAAEAGRFDALPIYKPEIECASREEIRALQLEKLKETVAYAYERVPYYRQKLDEMGVAPSDIQTLEDVRKLPFTDKAVLRETFPFGLFAVPLDDIRELHSSSGTTGKPVVVGYTDDDMDMWSECIARLVQMAGVVPGDIAQMAFGYGMFTGGFGLHYGLQKLGCMMIPAGSGNTERHIAMIGDYGTTVLIATPSYALHMCEVGERLGFDWKASTLRVGLFGGEPCPPGLKAEIEERMHIVCTDNYGLTEVMGPGVSGECLAARDMQHIAEDHFLWEVVDPETGVPCEAGRTGEIVIVGDTVAKGYFRNPEKTAAAFFDATLVDGTPVRAYRTGDAGHLDESGMLYCDGRFDSLVKVNGFRIELADVEENLGALPLVKQAAVVPVRRRERVAYLKACVVLRERPAGSDFEIARLIKARLAERVPGYMVPRSVALVGELPLTCNGKVDRKALAEA